MVLQWSVEVPSVDERPRNSVLRCPPGNRVNYNRYNAPDPALYRYEGLNKTYLFNCNSRTPAFLKRCGV
eukprot:1953471-Pyramimonas_sp.AAC.1